jgi:hypothetical protein
MPRAPNGRREDLFRQPQPSGGPYAVRRQTFCDLVITRPATRITWASSFSSRPNGSSSSPLGAASLCLAIIIASTVDDCASNSLSASRKTDARLSTLRKLVRMFTAHGVEFVMEGSRSGVTINTTAKDPVRQSSRKVLRTEPATKAEVPDQKTTVEQGLLWLRPFVRVKKADHA